MSVLTVRTREFLIRRYTEGAAKSILVIMVIFQYWGPHFRIMDEAPTGLRGWIVNIISATGAIVGILGIFVILFDLMGL